MKLLRVLIALFVLSVCTFAQTPVDAARVDQIVSADMAAKHTPAVQIALVKDGRIVYSKAFGTVDLENDLHATPETLFRTGSIAKSLTAVATLTLVDAGKLDLDAPIQKYCAPFPPKQWPITTRELLSHTSGIRHYREDEIEGTRHYKFMSDGFALFAGDPLLFPPGTGYNYSTYGYTVVGCVLEGASGETYYDYLHAHVLQAAGMTHTVVDSAEEIVPHRARGYRIVAGQVKNAGLMDSSYKIPGGGLDTTAEDLVRLGSALMERQILKPETLTAMWTPVKLRNGALAGTQNATSHYGLGWEITDDGKVRWHTGSQQGCNTAMAFVPEQRFGVAVLTNMEGARPIDIVNKVLETFAGATTARPKQSSQ
ncbi:MAG TPA: serine hydrolase domain-containing protein [Terriglobales bacterium]|nr:serine hydrolase domain-containing protein [Terriglobales bacterium]